MKESELKKTIECAKLCVITPTTERVIGRIYSLLIKRDEAALKYAQARRLMDKNNILIEINSLNEQIRNLLYLYN